MEKIMVAEQKTLKQYAKEAKKRLKEGFWQKCSKSLLEEIKRAEEAGIPASKVKEYYTRKVAENIKNPKEEEDEFYLKVKKLLETEGEVPDALGRLTDKEYFETLSYEEKQRYTLSLSEKYLQAIERYRKECVLEIKK